jgi:hypothetical protein
MTEHLPECPMLEPCSADTTQHCYCSRQNACIHDEMECICDRLRACEQRVAEETEAAMMEFFYWKPSPPHDQHYFADNICAYCVGHREALDAAAQRVAALPEYAMRDACGLAIDALREEKK